MANKHMRRCSTSHVIGEIKITMRYHCTPLEWAESRTLTIPNVSKDGEKQEFSFIAGRNAKWYSHFGRHFEGFYKTKHHLTMQSSRHTPWYLLKGDENSCPHKKLHMDVYSSFIYHCQNLEATKMYFSR